jgi:hypothetical protein
MKLKSLLVLYDCYLSIVRVKQSKLAKLSKPKQSKAKQSKANRSRLLLLPSPSLTSSLPSFSLLLAEGSLLAQLVLLLPHFSAVQSQGTGQNSNAYSLLGLIKPFAAAAPKKLRVDS